MSSILWGFLSAETRMTQNICKSNSLVYMYHMLSAYLLLDIEFYPT